MAYGMQIKKGEDWLWVSTTSGVRYEYATEYEAYHMLGICYPDQCVAQRLGSEGRVRTKEIPS